MIGNYIIDNYNNLDKDKPNIIRGAMNADLHEVKAALLDNPTCINEADPETGLTAMHIGGGEGDYDLVDLLCQQPGYDISLRDAWGRTPYFMARIIGRQDIVERMFQDIDANLRRKEALFGDEEKLQEDHNVTVFDPRGPT